MGIGDDAVIGPDGLDRLIVLLRERGYRVLGPVVRDGAIVQGEVGGVEELPAGWHDVQAPGEYRVQQKGDAELFGWAVGPASWKSEFFTPSERVWKASVTETGVTFEAPGPRERPVAIVGVRPCELAALDILDKVLAGGPVVDGRYAGRRHGTLIVSVECGAPSGTCFCTSMGTGPGAESGFDLALTELLDGVHRFYVRVGSEAGEELLQAIGSEEAPDADRASRQRVVDGARSRMGRTLQTEGLAELLARNLEHPRWADVAERCLSCGNCTLVCPTCFCSDVKDVSDVDGTIERRRTWASCFDVDHSYVHGGPVRPTTSSRYRQWLTHKLSTWWDQFDTSGCVGCGRCITWCPVGIDITEEAAAIRATDGALEAGGGAE